MLNTIFFLFPHLFMLWGNMTFFVLFFGQDTREDLFEGHVKEMNFACKIT